MENKKYLCPNCGSEMTETYEKPALNLCCPHCGCKIATTRWEKIDLDDKEYSILIKPIENPKIEQIKFLSKVTGKNFIFCKALFQSGGKVFAGSAVDVLQKRKDFDQNSIQYSIDPLFKY